jgi:hypothetical protein
MASPRTSFSTVIWLCDKLEKDVNYLEEIRNSSVCPIPQGSYKTINALIEYSRDCVERADKFRESYHEKASVRFFDFIAIWAGRDQIARHERQLEDCVKATKLAVQTIEAL